MKKVVSINLNGHAYQIDEDAYEQLAAYLDRADRDLRDNPDRAEILADLEQAIADKCQRRFGPGKSVVSADDVTRILEEMGPVDAGSKAATDSQKEAGATPPPGGGASATAAPASRRLYRIVEGAWLGGVCSGLAAYLNVDVTIVRILFTVLGVIDITLIDAPFSTLIYAALWFLIPEASTSEERAAASGAPFNARTVIERAKQDYADFKSGHFARAIRRRHRMERRHARAAIWPGWSSRYGWTVPSAVSVPPLGYAGRIATAAMLPVLTFLSVLWFWLAAFAALSLADSGSIYQWTLPDDMPLWMGIAGISIVYFFVMWPVQLARRTAYYALGGAYHAWAEAWDVLLWLAFAALVLWFAYTHFAPVRELVDHLPDMWHRLREFMVAHQRHRGGR